MLDTSGRHRSTRLSKHFTAGEFAKSGGVQFSKARIDPALVEAVEAVRTFINEPLTIVDGYYTWKHLAAFVKRQKQAKVPPSPHLAGRGAKIKARTLSSLELAKSVILACPYSTGVSVGDSSVEVYIKQLVPAVTSYMRDGEKRERATLTLREYRELAAPELWTDPVVTSDLDKVKGFVHWAIHNRHIRAEATLVDLVFYRSSYGIRSRSEPPAPYRFDPKNKRDSDLRNEIRDKVVRPALARLVAPAESRGGVPATAKGELVVSLPKPEDPGFDITGRYEGVYTDGSDRLGKTIVVNQASTHVELMLSEVLSPKARGDKGRSWLRLYGDLPDGPRARTFKLFSRGADPDSFGLVVRNPSLEVEWQEGDRTFFETFTRISTSPVLMERALKMFDSDPLIEAYEWFPLLQPQIAHLRAFFGDADRIGGFLKRFYEAKSDLQRSKTTRQEEAAAAFNQAVRTHLRDPRRGVHDSDLDLARFYLRHFLTATRWRRSENYPWMSQLDWIHRMTTIVEDKKLVSDLVTCLGLGKAKKDDHEHKYRITLKLSGGVVGVGYVQGTITVEKLDARPWPEPRYTFDVWFVVLGVGFAIERKKPGLGPIVFAGRTLTGEVSGTFEWLPHDFPGRVDLGYGRIQARAGVGGKAEGAFLHIRGRGGFPTLRVEFGDVDLSRGKTGVSAELLEAFGKIRDKKLGTDGFPSTKDKTDYPATYAVAKKTHFAFDSSVLTGSARQALRVMCAHERIALQSPASRLEITGHADAVGSADYNKTLSGLRAANTLQGILDIMGTRFGIPMDSVKVTAKGKAEAEGASENSRKMERRRVDVTLNGRLVLRLSVGNKKGT